VTTTIALVVAASILHRWGTWWPLACVAGVACWLLGGVPGAIAGAAGVVTVRSALQLRRRTATRGDEASDELLAIEAVGLAVAGGASFEGAATLGAERIGGAVGADIERAIRATRSSVATGFDHPAVESMFGTAETSRATGAPLAASLAALAADLREERSAVVRRRLARLPVRLLFPLALLILPGFVLMVVTPAVVGGLSRLSL
jgi:Type II secretion system (T2SS), protein F